VKRFESINDSLRFMASIIVFSLLRAGANIYSPEIRPARANFYSYVRRVNGAGGFHAYEKERLAALVSTFAPKFSHLPEELVGVVMMFYAHVGFY